MVKHARKILSDVHPDFSFKLVSGGELKNLHELLASLKDMDDETFCHHVTPDRNDFSNWVNHALKDDLLAEALETAYGRDEAEHLVRARMLDLQEKIQKHEDLAGFEELLPAIEESKDQTEQNINNDDSDEVATEIEATRKLFGFTITKDINHRMYMMSWGALIGLLLGILLGYILGKV